MSTPTPHYLEKGTECNDDHEYQFRNIRMLNSFIEFKKLKEEYESFEEVLEPLFRMEK